MNYAKTMQNTADEEGVLHRRVGRERHRVLLGLRLDAGRIVLADHVQRPDVQHDDAGDDERQQVVQRIEAVERRIADGIAAPQPGDDRQPPTPGIAENRLVMTVAAQKLICPHGST